MRSPGARTIDGDDAIARDSPFASLLPPSAAVVEATPAMWDGALFAEEAVLIRNAVSKRRREFAAGRNCARAALRRLGVAAAAIPADAMRAPVFPPEVAASITHTADYCAAAAIVRGEVLSIGIDAERLDSVSADIRHLIVAPDEADAMQRAAVGAEVDPIKVAFSAKESFYKSYYPLARQFLDWRDAHVALDFAAGTFRLRVTRPTVPTYFRERVFTGHFRVDEHRVYSAIALPASDRTEDEFHGC